MKLCYGLFKHSNDVVEDSLLVVGYFSTIELCMEMWRSIRTEDGVS